MPADSGNIFFEAMAMIGTVAAASAGLAWFMAAQFTELRRAIYRIITEHNKEDDDRFEELDKSIFELRRRNAAKDGTAEPEYRPLRRRRYPEEFLNQDGRLR